MTVIFLCSGNIEFDTGALQKLVSTGKKQAVAETTHEILKTPTDNAFSLACLCYKLRS